MGRPLPPNSESSPHAASTGKRRRTAWPSTVRTNWTRRPVGRAWLRFLDQFNDLLIYILLGAALLSAAVGDLKDPIVIGIVLSINAVLGYVQGNRADDAMAALKKMLEVTVRVRRSGTVTEVPSHELVPGDVVLMEAGDKVPADGRFLYTSSVSIDESTFTGESVPVDKTDEALSAELDTNERTNSGFMNTTLVRGRAEMVVTATGMSTEVGRLAGMLSATEDKPSPLQEQLDSLGKRLAVIAGIAVALVLAVDLARGEDFADAILSAVALAVAAIPEGLPAVVTVTLAIGVEPDGEAPGDHQAAVVGGDTGLDQHDLFGQDRDADVQPDDRDPTERVGPRPGGLRARLRLGRRDHRT